MKLLRTCSVISLLAVGACAPSTSAPAGTGGATAGTGGAATGTGGATTGTGGATTGTGGATTGTGGATTGTGGVIPETGGAGPGSGGAGPGTGGRGSGGAGGAATGGTAGGGAATGGTAGGGTATGGAAGGGTATGGAAGGGAVTVASIAGIPNANGATLMNSFILFPCLSTAQQDCVTFAGTCPNQNTSLPFEQQGLITMEDFKIGGTPGAKYNLSVRVNGIAEAKYYMGGTRAAGLAAPANPDAVAGTDTFYTGGTPVNNENYNVYKFIVKDMAGTEVQHYYLNSFPMVATPYENHQTFPIAFTHDIPVVGGGTLTYFTSDRNCRAISNCGIGYRSTACTGAEGRNVPNEPNLVVPTMYMGKSVASMNMLNGAAQPFHSQIFHITVMAVTPM